MEEKGKQTMTMSTWERNRKGAHEQDSASASLAIKSLKRAYADRFEVCEIRELLAKMASKGVLCDIAAINSHKYVLQIRNVGASFQPLPTMPNVVKAHHYSSSKSCSCHEFILGESLLDTV